MMEILSNALKSGRKYAAVIEILFIYLKLTLSSETNRDEITEKEHTLISVNLKLAMSSVASWNKIVLTSFLHRHCLMFV